LTGILDASWTLEFLALAILGKPQQQIMKGGQEEKMKSDALLRIRAIKQFRKAVHHQRKAWSAISQLADLFGHEQPDEVVRDVFAYSVTPHGVRDVAWQDLAHLLNLKPDP
jgi:hypothetical protein